MEARTSAVSVNRALVDWEDNSFPNLWFRYYEEYNGAQIASLYSVLLGSSAIITPAEREAMFVRFSETRDLVHRTAYGLTPQQLQYRPAASRWSVAENLEHITIVEQNILAGLAGTLQKPPAPEKKSAVTDEQLLANFGRVVQPLTAPERLLPTSRWPLVDLLNEFDATASAPSNSPLLRPTPRSCVSISCRIPSSANSIATNGSSLPPATPRATAINAPP